MGGSLLQERLAQRKRRGSLDFGVGGRDVQSSPVRGPTREERRPSSSGKGVKQVEEVSTVLGKRIGLIPAATPSPHQEELRPQARAFPPQEQDGEDGRGVGGCADTAD